MAKFNFRLQSFLNLKQKLEDQKKQEYGLAVAEVEHEKQVKEAMLDEKQRQIESFRTELGASINASSPRVYNDYIELLKQNIINQEKVIISAEKKAEKKRVELVEAMKERKMLEILEERAFAEYLREQQIAEQKLVDEVVSYRYNTQE